MGKSKTPFGLSKKELKEKITKAAFTIFRKHKLSSNLTKIFKFVSGTDWETEILIEFGIKNTSFGVLNDEVVKAQYLLHFIIQGSYISSEFVDDEVVDFDLSLYVKFKDGSEFEKIITDGEVNL